MRARLFACLGSFSVMALSNAIVPLLPAYSDGTALQGGIYGAYFLGAFLLTLPAGLISERRGRVAVMRWGLLVTCLSGIILVLFPDPLLTIAGRLLEGAGAGLFVAASMAYVNSLPDHGPMSGYLMASLNAGLVIGLVAGGYLAIVYPSLPVGLLLFTSWCAGSLLLASGISDRTQNPREMSGAGTAGAVLRDLVAEYRWLWYSVIILTGITGVVTSLYPDFSNAAPHIAGTWIAAMSIATIGAVLVASGMDLRPIPAIRAASLLMAAGVIVTYFTPIGFVLLGVLAGIAMIAQMAFLAAVTRHQGAAMGLYSTTGYLGMSIIPVISGVIAEYSGFFLAFCTAAFVAISVAFTIGRCPCRDHSHAADTAKKE